MNKKTNTFLFLAAATLFNIITTVVFFMLLFVSFFTFVKPLIKDIFTIWGLPVIFILAILMSFFLYRILIKQFIKKVDLNKYFDPILGNFEKKEKKAYTQDNKTED
ncbi:MAG: leader peptide processing enzyme [Spirochaetaceae bacterium]|nr:leader peptide processing enzyme [Spirochaetaceae bacterium]